MAGELQIGVLTDDGEVKADLERLTDIYKHKAAILSCIKQDILQS